MEIVNFQSPTQFKMSRDDLFEKRVQPGTAVIGNSTMGLSRSKHRK